MSYDVARRVRSLRKSRHITQSALARAIGTSPARLSLLERGASPTIDDLIALAAALDVRPSELLGDLDAPATR